MRVLLLTLLGLIGLNNAQLLQPGQCDNIPVEAAFNLNSFLGTWYEVSRFPNNIFNAECSSLEFTNVAGSLQVSYNGVNKNFEQQIVGSATSDNNEPAKLTLTSAALNGAVNFWILMTDYQNYALAYSCEDVDANTRALSLWKLGRTSSYPNVLISVLLDTAVTEYFGQNVTNTFIDTDHSTNACYKLPVIGPNEAVILPGQCDDNITVVQNFNVASFLGTWYEIYSYNSGSQYGACPIARYSLNADGIVRVDNSEVINQTLSVISGSASVASNDGSAVLNVVLEVIPGVFADQTLKILTTDYENYAISYSCVDMGPTEKRVFTWILSRTKELSPVSEQAVQSYVDSELDLNFNYYNAADQSPSACFYYPEPESNKPVVFTGTCDLNIPAMANFDPVAYMGLWHEIEAYPSQFQQGTCNNAFYTLVNGTVDVYNTQVINQRLFDIYGSAVLASTDGTAKLLVTFPVEGTNITVTTNYWVLDTDYVSYALVYTCEEYPNNERGVWSWKLSRSKTLSNPANNAINNIINTIDVLDQRYYQTRDQSVDGCFYIPEPALGKPVVFPGQCDNNVPVVTNFNLNQFAGTWYEIEAYPKQFQPGQCINHQFTAGGANSLNFVSSSVDDQFLTVTIGIVQFTSTDSSARLSLSFTSSTGTQITMPFWILTTDYTNYALAYSCVDDGPDFRNIYSWKLSRNTQLNAAANTEINNVISNNVVLDDAYFEQVDQSDDACFYLPEIPAGESVILPGQCDRNITVVQNFDVARFLGQWFEIYSYASESQYGECPTARYSLNDDGTVRVDNSEVINQALSVISGSASVASNDGSAVLNVVLEVIPGVFANQELKILSTDYDNYAISYSCIDINATQKRVFSWIVSRTKGFSNEVFQNVVNAVNSYRDLNFRYYNEANQSEAACFYYPAPVPNQPVVFPGTCDLNIPAMPNFDPVAYMGLWHEIEAYPSAFQQGTCNNAFYTLVNGTVDVYNTQVENQRLDEIYGSAVLASDDGTAKLLVTFPVANTNFTVTTSYWVLDTDYTSYALVYTCEQYPNNERGVWSWKLSRTKSLPNQANTIINNRINTIDVLDQRYYQTRDQSVDGCFYIPEPALGKPVVFPGQCDNNVSVVTNFNLNQFAGTWYEIEAYPKQFQPGQCINHVFTAGAANSLNFVSSSVDDQFLTVTNGVVQFTSTDSSGRLSLTFTSSTGAQITMPFWILSTDYNNYALAYSCVDDEPDFRNIYSWKLSRNTQLNAAANTAINNVISTNVVLDDAYFEPVDQSDDACFYLPEIPAGQSVVLPGQCDRNISVVQNFDVGRFLGQWFEIYSYASDSQYGECPIARYSLNVDGTVRVDNSEVINQTLSVISGSASVASNDGSAVLSVILEVIPGVFAEQELKILVTDYENYAISYACTDISTTQKRVFSWILSRSKVLEGQSLEAVNNAVNSYRDLNFRYYNEANQSDDACFYYPTPESNKPVVFPGSCDLSIPVVQNFDAVAYMGLWHEIEGYPSTFQQGTCNNAYYTLVNGTVDVYNTQVVNQSLDEIFGQAVLASNDGSAKLLVTFPVVGTNLTVTTNYWVLETDYTSYSLVYTCEEYPNNERGVFSWKLSRTKSLTPQANTLLNNRINTIDVLDQRYYETKDQTEAGCFYYPEPVLGEPVIFPGKCDESIPAVANFNFQQFEGLWHEISAYPKMQQEGQCINYNFNQTATNTYTIISNGVIDLTLNTTVQSLVPDPTGGSGKFIITVNNGGNEIRIPYWIISTDYNNYALAYSCVNLENDRRGVYSWKLSRTKEWRAEYQTAIADVVSRIDVLGEQYFENTDQSADGCFYLPPAMDEPTIFPGQCDENIPVKQNFDPTRYVGRWYDIASYYDQFQQGTCNDALYTLTPGGIVDVFNTQVVNQLLDVINGTAVLASTDGSGKLLVTFPIAGTDFTIDAKYWILDTDYDNYSLVYSCTNMGPDYRRVYSWKLSRTRSLTPAAETAINNIIATIPVLDDRYYITRDHSADGCFYYPEPVPGQSVVFRGQCNENLSVVQNFNVANYLGFWYDVGSYPEAFQFGSCATATYSLNPGGYVDVFNTQVVNQQLDTINGTAAVDSDDGSAKLLVTFPIAGTEFTIQSPYWVLATDYNNYALVYSCTNTGPESYRIGSWKLSRTRTLNANSQTAITNAIANVKELDERYYENRGTTEEDCFYYPENNGEPIVFEGLCETNLSVVNNFNINLFSGSWYESERYPSELEVGECVSSEFSVAGQTLTISQNVVQDETLVQVTGTATSSADGRGILTATLNTPNGNQDLTLYVLDTDYNNYALLYSCRNINANSRQVYSWKLSRSQSGLSQNANSAISNVVSENFDLFEGYYKETEQNNAACFYYPEREEEDSSDVVLPGPCDESIRGVANFDAARYLGRWFEIARYPQTFEGGQCARATYTLGDDQVDVYNENVINQLLDIQLGSAVVASTDGTGLLNVTFIVNGETRYANYYILSTDYDNYALVYSCRNTADGNRQVSSWKISRTPTLANQYENIMASVIENTQGLRQEYYKPVSQSDEDCFYIPEVNENEAVLFRGQCQEPNGIQGFDVQRYLGWWHEIESYPRGVNSGDCSGSQLSSSGNQFQAVDTEVFGNTASLNTYTLQVSANGKLTKVSSDGTTTELWVLATDYDNYALLYSCEDVDSEYRRVWSAKHSKSRQLSAAAQNAMTQVINANQVLYQQFYSPVDQSDSACFHYPEVTGQQVILPGQCDGNIPVQQNFDAVQYTGTWYQIERYPQIHETGSCTGARYSLDESTGVVDVLNWEVVDGVLETIEGSAELISNDGSAKLIVTLPVRGTDDTEFTTYELYVLGTDYNTYSLAYSCQNVNEFQRAVGVWKLSRTRTMPAAGNTAINALMNQREELYQPYFIQTGQNDDCEEPSSSVVFRSSFIVLIVCSVWHLLL